MKKHFFKQTLYIVHEKLLLYREGAKNAGKRHKKLPKPTLKVQGKVRPNGKRNFLVAGVIKIFLPGMMCICTCMHKISFPNLSKGFFFMFFGDVLMAVFVELIAKIIVEEYSQ